MNAQELLNAWGAKRWPAHAGKEFRIETDRGSGCPTCGYDPEVTVYADDGWVAELGLPDFSKLLNEILGAAP
jgi:hypothetical protein